MNKYSDYYHKWYCNHTAKTFGCRAPWSAPHLLQLNHRSLAPARDGCKPRRHLGIVVLLTDQNHVQIRSHTPWIGPLLPLAGGQRSNKITSIFFHVPWLWSQLHSHPSPSLHLYPFHNQNPAIVLMPECNLSKEQMVKCWWKLLLAAAVLVLSVVGSASDIPTMPDLVLWSWITSSSAASLQTCRTLTQWCSGRTGASSRSRPPSPSPPPETPSEPLGSQVTCF